VVKLSRSSVHENYRRSGRAPISGLDPIFQIGSSPDSYRMRSRSLLTQVLTINVLLIVGTGLLATIAVNANAANLVKGRDLVVLGLALAATLLGNWLLLRRRFKPLDELISTMEEVDLAHPRASRPGPKHADNAEVQRLQIAFDRMIARLETQRREAGRAAVQAQERERRRIAQDLHDEVNQALTAVSLRLQASIERAPPELRRELAETKRVASKAMDELLVLARQLRPAVLDDHGLVPALHSQVRDFGERTRIDASFHTRGAMPQLSPEQQLVLYRVTQECLSNVAQHADACRVEVELSFVGRTVLRISDDGHGFVPADSTKRNGGGLGLSGMRERALLIGGRLSLRSRENQGTRVELTIE
jgi:two-component system, NarL family, sensor histidine kinase UhpB